MTYELTYELQTLDKNAERWADAIMDAHDWLYENEEGFDNTLHILEDIVEFLRSLP